MTPPSPPPPPLRSTDDGSAAESARRRFTKGRHLTISIPRLSNLKVRRAPVNPRALSEQHILSGDNDDATEISLNDPCIDLNIRQDIYRWAVVYENQRGFASITITSNKRYLLYHLRITIFSTPYYSRLGLLPHDPPPFTIPEADGRRDRQPQVSLHDYPLPDGTWRWVSTAWMVDMRSEGEVHYDGFEYNWFFRRHKWRPEPGAFNAGGWVRRRRWVRLMMRPAHPIEPSDDGYSQSANKTPPPTRYSIIPDHGALQLEAEKALVWRGDAEDWKRCHHLMVRLNRDGTKLDLWREWLGVPPRVRHRKVWTEDDYTIPSEESSSLEARAPALEGAQREDLAGVVRDHVRAAFYNSILQR
jgi:Integral peroxisomal membrane peroxin